ncbi:tRNA (N(6)-L-threonylcarbamoyladenosine(37)-C(2))-methylthiotransferase MtaB [Novipirellula artificiosorum]|uniref:Threonylcarbamoyladenosine tRNA methylthiotransferase MtaB n=1 Tax=Novipirellula artificiosorum TaxID=2528016 RepID=A0A5C6D6Y0_9BACT|nr:tRNA (N(6)-L-threonylcarbamoyladenosine(37)-C(2))-methylthiotransferase MtaB [Novipirellula artificiosorum]TWU32953.1 Threonylcarbamoyladenosine tRNA methylthiotransferase MtaB [Novipirellula artificiosorum]
MSAKLRVATLGCKVNQYETELVRQGLQRIGFTDCSDSERADVCVVNTCTVTAEGDSKSRQIVRRLARQNPQAKIVVMGCYATRAPEEVGALPGVTEVVTDKREIPDLLSRFGVVDVPTGLDGFSGRHRAYVKVQDGCLLRCSYCIIPYVRPKLESRPLEHIVEEVRRLVDAGHREVVLTGIHLGHYGVDWNRNKPKPQWIRLTHLLRRLCQLSGDFRIRLSSIEATEVTRELIAVMKDHGDRIVPHLHLCLQSGSDSVLRRMRRRWGTRMFLDRCRLFREAIDRPAISTDVIVGFPGETEAEFEQTLETCRHAGFSKIHVFPYSQRRGTPAAEMQDQVPKSLRSERVASLGEVERQLRANYFKSLVGSEVELLTESQKPIVRIGNSIEREQLLRGTTCRYAAAELVERAGHDCHSETGRLVKVQVTDSDSDRLIVTRTPG